jgi:hypothetical protein
MCFVVSGRNEVVFFPRVARNGFLWLSCQRLEGCDLHLRGGGWVAALFWATPHFCHVCCGEKEK